MLTIENLKVNFNGLQALNIQGKIEIEKGDRIGIIGSNGAGKSTLTKAILGLVRYQGEIHSELKANEIAIHLQENNYIKTVPVKNIIQAVLNTTIATNEKLKELIDFFEFESCLNQRFQNLSGGQKQRLTIILVLMQEAPLTLFDEVTSGLDFETRTRLMEKIIAWYEGKDTSICVVSHYYDELEALTDKLLILEKGELVAFGKTKALFKEFCGEVVLTVEDNPQNSVLLKDWKQIEAPERLLAFSCENKEEELQLVTALSQNNINYQRSNFNIEILFTNALAKFRKEKGENTI